MRGPFQVLAFLCALFLFAVNGDAREIEFSGYTWIVKRCDTPCGPGPNYFCDSAENAWVDPQGRLHMKITYSDGKWCCAEVINTRSLGYGEYCFRLESPVDTLDKNVVLGLFTWDDNAPGHNYREIDIEFARWGQEGCPNAQYVVQPWDTPGNIHRWCLALTKPCSTHCFDWSRRRVSFKSIQSDSPCVVPPANPTALQSWEYTGDDIPPPGQENPRINLWLFNADGVGPGDPPSDGNEVEVVITAFEFVPPRWSLVHNELFTDPSDLDMFREYRDKLLSKTAKGKRYVDLLYAASDDALRVFLDHPQLLAKARSLVHANKGAVSKVLHGGEATIHDTDEVLAFLDAFAEKSPPTLRLLIGGVKNEMTKKRELGGAFVGFKLGG
jgi:hypothetical protein